MVEIIIIIFGLFAGIHMFLEKRSWLNPGTIFMFYWIIVVFMANLRLYGLRETSNKAYLFVLVGIIAFYTGSLLAIKMKIKISTMKKSALFLKSGVYETNYTFLNTSCIVVIIYTLSNKSNSCFVGTRLFLVGNSLDGHLRRRRCWDIKRW